MKHSNRLARGVALAAVVAASLAPAAAFAAPGSGHGKPGGGGETVANSLSVPAVFVPSLTGAPTLNFACGAAVDPATLATNPAPLTGFEVAPANAYYVQGTHKWQASCATATTATATGDWGDNLGGDAMLKAGSPIRVEMGLLEDAPTAHDPAMTGWDVIKLQPSLLDRESAYGTLANATATPGVFTSNPVTPFPEVRVWDAAATLKIYNVLTPDAPVYDGKATAEINATGRVVYGYNLRVPTAGKYVIEFRAPTVTLSNASDGHTLSIEIVVGGGGGSGGGRGGGGVPRGHKG